MKYRDLSIYLQLIIVLCFMLTIFSVRLQAEWWFPYTGKFNGYWDVRVGTHFWEDHFNFRNLQLRSNLDLAPGLRFNTVIRSNKKFDTIKSFNPVFDELYLEGYGFNESKYGQLGLSFKVGKVRYLRFPYPDRISMFDPVPGTEDLRIPGEETGYSGELLTLDYKTRYGFGYHMTGINWDFAQREGANFIENYLYFYKHSDFLEFEARVGRLQLRHPGGPVKRGGRPYQLGASAPGYNLYLGGTWRDYQVGLLYEELYDEKYDERDIRAGLLVTFAFSRVTEYLGKFKMDYTRSPQGFVVNLPLLNGLIGNIRREPPEDSKKTGEIKTERVITFWQNGQARNLYEHRISRSGVTDPEAIIVIKEKPWFLKEESLNIPGPNFESLEALRESETHSARSAQNSQEVIYEFYKKENPE